MDSSWLRAMRCSEDRIGLIAGSGPLPLLFAKEAGEVGLKVVAVAHLGETSSELEQSVESVTWVRVGELGKLVAAFQEQEVRSVVFLGGIDKKRALRELHLDEWAMRLIGRLQMRGDDTLLGALAAELESLGMRVLSSQQLLSPWLAQEGVLTRQVPTEQQQRDVRLGIKALERLGALDIGQTVVVKEGVILAVEAIEGTDQAIRRAGALGGVGAVVVKGSKPGQDMRFDVPVVGEMTIQTMLEVGAKVLALEAGRTLLIQRPTAVDLADSHGIVLLGWRAEVGHVEA
ncbi:MAG: LpxI family protein [Thermodesulfobacteriota bacterium]